MHVFWISVQSFMQLGGFIEILQYFLWYPVPGVYRFHNVCKNGTSVHQILFKSWKALPTPWQWLNRFREQTMSHMCVFEWHAQFRASCTAFEDYKHTRKLYYVQLSCKSSAFHLWGLMLNHSRACWWSGIGYGRILTQLGIEWPQNVFARDLLHRKGTILYLCCSILLCESEELYPFIFFKHKIKIY